MRVALASLMRVNIALYIKRDDLNRVSLNQRKEMWHSVNKRKFPSDKRVEAVLPLLSYIFFSTGAIESGK